MLKIKIYLLKTVGRNLAQFSRWLEKIHQKLYTIGFNMWYMGIIYEEYGDK